MSAGPRMAVLVLVFSLLFPLGGCFKTFRSYRLYDDTKFKGVPTMMHKPYMATVTWEKGQTTQHYCTLPVMYAVDVCPAPVGKTEAKFTMADDGQLTSAEAKIDQEIPELITAIGQTAGAFSPAKGRADKGVVFVPGLDKVSNPAIENFGAVVSITFQELCN